MSVVYISKHIFVHFIFLTNLSYIHILYMYIHILYMYIHICIYVYVNIDMYIHIHIYTFLNIILAFIYFPSEEHQTTPTHIYTYVRTHTHSNRDKLSTAVCLPNFLVKNDIL